MILQTINSNTFTSNPTKPTTMTVIEFQLHRFDFSPEIVDQLEHFTKIHVHEDRHAFKASWTKWIEDPVVSQEIQEEVDRLHNLGFQGDVLEKMFKSVRYYFRKKYRASVHEEPANHSNKKPKYMEFTSNFIQAIDLIISKKIQAATEQVTQEKKYTRVQILAQKEAYAEFCTQHQNLILQEFIRLKQKHGELPETISQKMKKMFKNRFYQVRSQASLIVITA